MLGFELLNEYFLEMLEICNLKVIIVSKCVSIGVCFEDEIVIKFE